MLLREEGTKGTRRKPPQGRRSASDVGIRRASRPIFVFMIQIGDVSMTVKVIL